MYFAVGWPKLVDCNLIENSEIIQICCDRVKILLAVLGNDFLGIWYTKPFLPIVYHKRDHVDPNDYNKLLVWKPDSSMIAVATISGNILFYKLHVMETTAGVYQQIDPPFNNLKRDSAELFIKEVIPSFSLKLTFRTSLYIPVSRIVCVSLSQIMVATESEKILRMNWDGTEERDYSVDLKRTPFSINHHASYAVPLCDGNIFITFMEYSPLVGGFAITLSDGRAAFLTSSNLKFDPNQVQGVWAQQVEDATCCAINHKFRLLTFGQKSSISTVFTIEDSTGGLELSHKLALSSKVYPGYPGSVNDIKWTPDGCAIAMSWSKGGFSVWSTFGTMLICSLGWDYGVHTDLIKNNPLNIFGMEWLTEGYQLLLLRKNQQQNTDNDNNSNISSTSILQLDFVKSALTVNPCMASQCNILLQGDDKLYINQGNSLEKIYFNPKFNNSERSTITPNEIPTWFDEDNIEVEKSIDTKSMLGETKHWIVIQLPITYAATNWPIRFSAIDNCGLNIAIAGRTGLAHYSLTNKKWKLFGNETQEKDFVVTGGLLWWENFIFMGSFSLIDRSDEIRMYPKDSKLDNRFVKKLELKAPVILINIFKDQLVVFCADGLVSVVKLKKIDNFNTEMTHLYEVDIRNVCTHPACTVSLALTNVKNESNSKCNIQGEHSETIILNVSGRILMIQKENNSNSAIPLISTCLASNVECIWFSLSEKRHLKGSLWLYCGMHGMRVWLPVLPKDKDLQRNFRHTFISKRIMLSFPLKLYPLAILFEDVIILGVENDTMLYMSDLSLHFSIPFCILERKNQVYLHQILRQLIRRNLGYNAWEIAIGCINLPYFSHSLELLLHEVLEDEATSKEPIPDALLPSVLEFIQEFPVYLQTIVQCARKTEIALWPYLFAAAGKPKDLFLKCLSLSQLETAASYLIILQNLEPSTVSRQYATLLLDTALENKKWELSKDLVRFLKAIDPNDIESPRSSFVVSNKFNCNQPSQTARPNADDLSLILGSITRGRSYSTNVIPKEPNNNSNLQSSKEVQANQSNDIYSAQRRKKSVPSASKEKNQTSAEDFFIEVILQRHARILLEQKKLEDLGYMSAALDFHLVSWLAKESDRAAKIDDFIAALNKLHLDLDWPKPDVDILNLDINETKFGKPFETQYGQMQGGDSGYSSLPVDKAMPNLIAGNADFIKSDSITSNYQINTYYDNSFNDKNTNLVPEKSIFLEDSLQDKSIQVDNFSVDVGASSLCSEEVSVSCEEFTSTSINNIYSGIMEKESKKKEQRNIPPRMEVKMRYLLQIFTEANCLDYSLLLSILLLDAASVTRITDAAIRSSSLSGCCQIRNALKDITRWSFNESYGYKPLMLKLQPDIQRLDKFVGQQELTACNEDKNTPKVSGTRRFLHMAHSTKNNISSTKETSLQNSNFDQKPIKVTEKQKKSLDTTEIKLKGPTELEDGSICQIM